MGFDFPGFSFRIVVKMKPRRHMLTWLLTRVCQLSLVPICAQAIAADPLITDGRVIQLVGDLEPGMSRIRFSPQYTASHGDLLKSNGTLSTNGVRLDVSHNGRHWKIRSLEGETVVTAEAAIGWRCRLGAMEEARFEYDAQQGMVRVEAFPDTEAKAPGSRLQMTLGDGTSVEMGARSKIRLETYKDASYVLSGSGLVTGTMRDHARFVLGVTHVYLAGVALSPTVPSESHSNVAGAAPGIAVQAKGKLGGNVELATPKQRMTVGPSGSHVLSTPNGSEFTAEQDTLNRVLRVSVKKGLFVFEPAELGAGSTIIRTGQSASLAWDSEAKSFDISHDAGDDVLLALFPNGVGASLSPGGALRIVRTSQNAFSAQTTKGSAAILDKASQRLAALSINPQVFEVVAGAGSSTLAARIHLLGAGGDAFRVRIGGNVHTHADAANQDFTIVDAGVELKPMVGGTRWLIHPLEKPAEVTVEGLPGWKATLESGESMTFIYAEERGLIEVATARANRPRVQRIAHIQLPDGASASVGLYSIAKTDYFKDGTFSFSGSGSVVGTISTGAGFSFAVGRPPITGGTGDLLRNRSTSSPPAVFSPLITIKAMKEIGGNWRIEAGGNSVLVNAGSSQRASFTNGTTVEFSVNARNETLIIKGVKLLANLEIAGFENVRPRLATGQAILLDLDLTRRTMEASQVGGDHMLALVFDNQSAAALGPNARVRINAQQAPRLTLQTISGEVSYFDVLTGQTSGVGVQPRVILGSGREPEQKAKVRLTGLAGGGLKAQFDKSNTFGAEDIPITDRSFVFNGVELGPVDKGQKWRFRAVEKEVEISVGETGAWMADLALGESVLILFRESDGVIEFRTEQASERGREALVKVRFPDGREAKMGVFSFLRSELFSDRTYSLVGRGTISGVDADGRPFDLGSSATPFTGGPMRSVQDARGTPGLVRGTPLTLVEISRDVRGSIEVEAPPQRISVGRGEKKPFRTGNGTEVQFELDSTGAEFTVRVAKGLIGLTIAERESVKPILLSGHSLVVQWNGFPDRLGFLHVTGDEPIVAEASNRFAVVLNPGSSVSLKEESVNSYSVEAVKGKPATWESGEVFALEAGTRKLFRVMPSGRHWDANSATKVQLLGGAPDVFRVKVNGGRVLSLGV